jgi:hypothetical protein
MTRFVFIISSVYIIAWILFDTEIAMFVQMSAIAIYGIARLIPRSFWKELAAFYAENGWWIFWLSLDW